MVIFPNGVPPDPDKPASFIGNPQTWNDGSERFNSEIDDVGFISRIVENTKDDFRIDPRRIYAAGFSNGASLAFLVGIQLNETIAAIAPVAGALWVEDFVLESPVSLLYITGTGERPFTRSSISATCSRMASVNESAAGRTPKNSPR